MKAAIAQTTASGLTGEEGIHRIIGPTILTARGYYFDFENPEGSVILLSDIAHALSQICRFTGHTRRFYSVAEHSVHVSRLVRPEDALVGLLHDAAEAYIGDVSRPLKSMMPRYKALEARIEAAIFHRFDLKWPMPETIKIADRAMLAIEKVQAMGNSDKWPGLEKIGPALELQFWRPHAAQAAFVQRFRELTTPGGQT